MSTLNIILGVILILAALFLIIAVLFQTDKSDGLSGVIGGGSDNYLGNTKGKTSDKILSRLTTIVAIFFALIVLFIYIIQDNPETDGLITATGSVTTTAAETTDAASTDETKDDAETADSTDADSDSADISADESTEPDTTAEDTTAEDTDAE